MTELPSERNLKIVDAFDLPETIRILLRPGELVKDADGRRHRLPRYFYEIPSYEEAMAIRLTNNFRLNEFIRTDLREAEPLREYPRYVPCAVRLTAFYLQRVRDEIGSTLHISVNGGYRSPSHDRNQPASPHMWGTAVDIYRIGTSLLQSEDQINKFGRIAERVADELCAFPYGSEPGATDDHLHLDLGYVFLVPREVSEDRMEMPQETPRFAWEERRGRDRRTQDE